MKKAKDSVSRRYDQKTNASPRTVESHARQEKRLLEANTPRETKRAIMKNRAEENANARREAKKSGGIKSVTTRKDGRQYNYKDGSGYYISYY